MNLTSLNAELLAHGLNADKRLGQHFLLQESWTARIASLAGNLEGVGVVEIGPGPGGLTRALLQRSAAREVVAVEMDRRFTPLLEPLAEHFPGRFRLVMGDALRLTASAQLPAPRAIVANLPYNVGTELLIHWLLETAAAPETYLRLVLMFQQEVAQRLYAAPGSKQYGRLSVLAQWLCRVQGVLHVPAGAFTPPPKVESEVVMLTPYSLAERLPAEPKALQQVTAAAFNQRRKMLRGALKTLTPEAETLLAEAGIDPTWRAEQVDVAGFCRLANAWAAFREQSA